MAWRDDLREASFRGVSFMVEGHDTELGRRTALHEFPNRDMPFVEDMGALARQFAIEAFVLGEDYMEARDELTDALNEAGEGELVHPYLGTFTVTVTRARMAESTAEGGMARFSIVFTQTGEPEEPDEDEATEEEVIEDCDAAGEAVEAEFADAFTVESFPAFVVEAAQGIVGQVFDKLQGLTQLLPLQTDALGSFLPALASAQASVATLMRDPAELGGQIAGLVGDLVQLPKESAGLTADTSLKIARQLFDFGADLPAVPLTTPSRLRQAANQDALVSLVQKTASIAAARATAEMSFPSFGDAVKVRDELAEHLDTQAGATNDDASHFALVDLRASMVRDITKRGANLSRTVAVAMEASLPTLVMAYNLYGDAGREDEIAARNKTRHPGFITGGRPLEVLADA
jgi:prophage DNA circulation protein